MKSHIKAIIIGVLLISCLFSGCSAINNTISVKKKSPVIGVVVAKFDDNWRTSVRNELYKMAKGKIEIDIWNGGNSQETENKNIDALIKRNVNVLAVNLVDIKAAASVIDKAKNADIPVIFFNTEPSTEDMKKWDKIYYVGAKGEQSGEMQGKILVNYFKDHPTSDGTIRYVMLKGQEDHPDTLSRTKYSVKTIEDAGFKVKDVEEDTASWERDKGTEKMNNALSSNSKIDCVISNNDDMALGAIDALKSNGYFTDGKYIPVVGVDATNEALNAIKEGTLLGTVLNDAVNQGKAIFNLADILASGKVPDKNNSGNEITDGKYIWIDYRIITKENINDAK